MWSGKINTLEFKEIILCADDFAQNHAISEGILSLVKAKRINAISCLVNFPLWAELSKGSLGSLSDNAPFVGLHINLTWGKPLSRAWRNHYGKNFTSLAQLIKQCYLHRLNLDVIQSEIRAQVDNFSQQMNALPDFIDGHQHVHQLPIIRDALLSMHQKEKLAAFFRSTTTSSNLCELLSVNNFPKRHLISLLGGCTFKKQLLAQAIPTNTSFSGIYNFNQAKNYPIYFRQFLNRTSHKGLIMCHPGLASKGDKKDPLNVSRPYELEYFRSNDFVEDLRNTNIRLMDKMNGQVIN